MADRIFDVTYTVTARIILDQLVFDNMDESFRENFYDFDNEKEVVDMITRNMIDGTKLSDLDGFANLPDKFAEFKDMPEYDLDEIAEIKVI